MRELSLFSGGGGGLLATTHLLGWNTVGYVETDDYCQQIIKQRIKDGMLPEAPIFGDIAAFNREGYAESYRGMVDVVTGGFPCQDVSCAGKGEGIHGERSGLWFDMAETVRLVGPRYVFIENVPALLVRGFEHVLGALSQMGFDAVWGIVSAADVGAPHLRKRLWVVAHHNEEHGYPGRHGAGSVSQFETTGLRGCQTIVAHAETSNDRIDKTGEDFRQVQQSGICNIKRDLADTQEQSVGAGLRQNEPREIGRKRSGDSGCPISNPKTERFPNRRQTGASTGQNEKIRSMAHPGSERCCESWWATEPDVGRVAYGVAHRVDRIKAIGNGQVPGVAAAAWSRLAEIISGWVKKDVDKGLGI